MVELPQGTIIEVRRGGHDVLAKLSGDMNTLGISGYIRIERRPKGIIPRVSQVLIDEGIPKIALHESDLLLTGLAALLEIERDSMALDALISLIELSTDDLIRIVNLYPDAVITAQQNNESIEQDDWWNYVKLNTSSWRREERLPTQEVTIEAPEYIRQITEAKLQKFTQNELILTYGDSLLIDNSRSDNLFELGGILAAHGRPILVISRTSSQQLFNEYSIPKQACCRISSLGEDSDIEPDMDVIEEKITQFLWANKQAVVVFSGLEYLLSMSTFSYFMKVLRRVVDRIRNGDHLLLSNCDLEVFETMQRHSFLKQFELIPNTFIESLIMDPEALKNHPIGVELTDEELSWMNQQINFIASENTEHQITQGVLSGGATTLASEDLTAVSDELASLVDDWSNTQESTESNPGQLETTPISLDETGDVNRKPKQESTYAVEEIESVEGENLTLAGNQTSIRTKKQQYTAKQHSNSPRKALRIKRVKKRQNKPINITQFDAKISLDAAAKSQVVLPEMSDMQTDRIPKQVVDIDIVNRSMKIEHALKEMLSNPLSSESKELSEVTTQTSSRSNYDLPSISMPRHIKVGHNLNSTKTKAISKPKANPNNLKSSREYAARVQNQIDVDKNYATWVSKYEVSKNAKIDNEEVDN